MAMDIWPKLPPDSGKYLTLGIEFIVVFGTFLAAGILLDRYAKTGVVFTLIGMVVGFGGAMYRMLRVSREYWKRHDGPPRH